MSKCLLNVEALNVRYGMVQAVKGVDFDVFEGEIVTLIGSNGAGKTSILRALSGLIPSLGNLELFGKSFAKSLPHERVALGLVQCPEGRGIFSHMTVFENLELGAYLRRDKAGVARDFAHVFTLFPLLKDRVAQIAGTLSGGEQQMLAISRAILSRPKILLLDEPSLGLAPKIVAQIFQILVELNRAGMTILLVEQNAHMALSIAHRAYVLETGKIVLSGKGRDLLASPEVQRHYLGM